MGKHKRLIFICLTGAAITIGSCKTYFETTTATYTAAASPAAFERGKNLVANICSDCHYDKRTDKFIGRRIHDIPGFMGKVYSANLTNSKTNGIPPRYTDAQLRYLLKTGITKDGHFLPYMLHPNMAEDDINAIIVYLRSGDAPVAAADTTIGLTNLNFMGKTIMNATAKPLPYKANVKLPAANDGVANGRYLVDNIGCFHCHSKSLTNLDYLDIEQTKGFMTGGQKFKTPNGLTVYASNITPDKQTGIGNYSKMDFRKAVRQGESPEGKLHPPMPQFHALSDNQVDDIYAYIQSLPAVVHQVKGH
ncbi:c-type cytochrome [Mucilaginibacter sp. AW1-3]